MQNSADHCFSRSGEIVILEAKTGDAFLQARKQLEEYSLLLPYFHKASTECRIVPIIVSPDLAKLSFLKRRQGMHSCRRESNSKNIPCFCPTSTKPRPNAE